MKCPYPVAQLFASGQSIPDTITLTGLRPITIRRYYAQWQRGEVRVPVPKSPRLGRVCPEHVANFIDHHPKATADMIAEAFGVTRQSAQTYLSLYRRKGRRTAAWYCATCSRSSREAPRHCNASICRDCYNDLTQQDVFLCRQCQRRIGRADRSPTDAATCTRCVAENRHDTPTVYELAEWVNAQPKGTTFALKDIMSHFPAMPIHTARQRVHWMLRLKLVKAVSTYPRLRIKPA
jgi:hypothetical protein